MVCFGRCIFSLICSICICCLTAFAQRGPAVVELKTAEMRMVTPSQATVGTIMPTRRAVIGSAVDGRVVEFNVREGDRVAEDQELAKLLTQTIELELAAAKAELELREQELAELVNGSLPQEIAQAKARMEATHITAEYLEKDKERLSTLKKNNAVSISEFEGIVSLWLAAQQRYQEAQAAYQLAIDGPRTERITQAVARVTMQQAIVERLSDQIKKHTMVSRFAGYVTVEHTEVGQWLPRGEPVCEIIALDEVYVIAKVAEAYIPYIHVGDAVPVDVPTIRGSKFTGKFTGKVAAIIPEADERSRTFPVKIRVTNEFSETGDPLLKVSEPVLKAGMLARATLATGDPHEALMVPKDALVLGGEEKMIWTIDPNSIEAGKGNMVEANAIAVPVQTGVEENADIEVTEIVDNSKPGTLKAGTLVVIRGNERIPPSRPGQPPSRVTWVKPTEPSELPSK